MTIPHEDEVLGAFQRAATHLPFYTQLLTARGVVSNDIHTLADFISKVPLITKEDVFVGHDIADLCVDGVVPAYVSAIVSSGTSGVFSFGLLTENDVKTQRRMLDSLLEELFHANANPPLIINALPMGVSFVSSYPVIPTSTRTDIIRKVITTFGKERQVIIVTDPHILKKLLEEGIEEGVVWENYMLSCIVGGALSSDSFIHYLHVILNDGEISSAPKNHVLQTMGITEVALNIFGSTPDLVYLRHVIEKDETMRKNLFGAHCRATPEIMYHMAKSVHVEIVNEDKDGVGDIVLTHLDTTLPTPLIRYNTGDKGRIIPHEELASIVLGLPVLPFPVVAVYGRSAEYAHAPVTPLEVEEILYQNHTYVMNTTGHFIIAGKDEQTRILVQMKEGITYLEEKTVHAVPCVGIPYLEFPSNVTLNYEHKWKHIS